MTAAFHYKSADVGSVGGVAPRHGLRLCVKELPAFLLAVGRYTGEAVAVAVENLSISNLLAVDGARDLLPQTLRAEHIPSAVVFARAVPKGFEFKEGVVLQVARLVEDDKRLLQCAQVVFEVVKTSA